MIYNDVLNELNKFGQRYSDKKFINIYTDSKFVIDNLDIGGYPKFEYYYKLIDDMNNLANLLNNYNV